MKRLFSAAKAGHAGTLDPLASGILPVLFGEATKFSAFLLDADKEYVAEVQLGVTTTTGDAEGQVTARSSLEIDDTAISAALERFRGESEQVPPMHSALKHGGRPLYEMARAGVVVARKARKISIRELELLERSGSRLTIRLSCSKGTYIRVFAEDLGRVLGTGAHLAALRRTRAGRLRVGSGFEPDVEIGPLMHERAVAKCAAHVGDALARGGRLLAGGRRHRLGRYFFEPTVIADATDDMAIFSEETFGPIAALARFSDEGEVVHGRAGVNRQHRVQAALEGIDFNPTILGRRPVPPDGVDVAVGSGGGFAGLRGGPGVVADDADLRADERGCVREEVRRGDRPVLEGMHSGAEARSVERLAASG